MERRNKNEAESVCRPHVPAIPRDSHLLQVFSLSFSFPNNFNQFVLRNTVIEFDTAKPEIDRVNGIEIEEIHIELSKRQHLSPEFQGYRIHI